jgi:hypothetical protein
VVNWALNSHHTLDIPAGTQQQDGLAYVFGRWNSDITNTGSTSQSITVSPGDGTPPFPSSSPKYTAYTANFIQYVPFSSLPAYPSPAAGSLTEIPLPASLPGISGQYYLAGQPVTMRATPNSGYNFYQWYGYYYCNWSCYISFNDPSLTRPYWITQNAQPDFVQSQVTTITTNPSGLYVLVDGNYYTSPAKFSPDANANGSAWAIGTSHSISVPSADSGNPSGVTPQTPWSPNTSYLFANWSDSGLPYHTITVPSGNATYTATFNTEVTPVLAANPSCGGSVSLSPPTPFNAGTSGTFTATASPGWVFAGWQGALSGTTNPQMVAVNNEMFVQANFNTIPTPLTVTSLSPPSVAAGSADFTLTVNGTGFTNTSYAYVWYNNLYNYRAVTYISPTELQIPILAADVATPGGIQIIIENIVGGNCWVYSAIPLLISPGSLGVSTGSVNFGVQALGSSSPSQIVTISNPGSTPVTISNLSLAGGSSSDFTLASTCPISPGTLAPSANCQLTLGFNPTAEGPRRSTVTVADNAATGTQFVLLSGVGAAAGLSSSSLSFGSHTVGSHTPLNLTITNRGSAVLNLWQMLVSGTNSADFSETTTCGATLGAGAACTVTVTFTPGATGSRTALLLISNDGGGSPEAVTLTGTGT